MKCKIIIGLSAILYFTGCYNREQTPRLSEAEKLMQNNPDSALAILQKLKPEHFQGNNQNVQRWKLQTGIQNVSQPSPVTSPARFLLCTMVLNGHE